MNSENILFDFISKSSERIGALRSSYQSQYNSVRDTWNRLILQAKGAISAKTQISKDAVAKQLQTSGASVSQSLVDFERDLAGRITASFNEINRRIDSYFEGDSFNIADNLYELDTDRFDDENPQDILQAKISGEYKRARLTPFVKGIYSSVQVDGTKVNPRPRLPVDELPGYLIRAYLNIDPIPGDDLYYQTFTKLVTAGVCYVYGPNNGLIRTFPFTSRLMSWLVYVEPSIAFGDETKLGISFELDRWEYERILKEADSPPGPPNAPRRFFFQITLLEFSDFVPKFS